MEVPRQLHERTALPPGKESPVLIEYDAGWVSESVWTIWSEEKSLPPAGYSADSLVTIPTTLSWLLIFYK